MAVAEGTFEIRNRLGLHLRAASTLAQAAARFSSAISISRGKDKVNARSITSLLTLGAEMGSRVKVKAEGPDAEEALKAIEALFEDKFGEE